MANNLPFEKKVLVASMLCEGSSIRAIERITGVNRNTIMGLNGRLGDACAKLADEKMRGLSCQRIEVDEIWGFIGAKRKIAGRVGAYGDVWTFIALDSESKLVPSYVVGKRDAYHAKAFMADLAARLSRRVQLSSDALGAYPDAVERAFGSEVDYGQLVKEYSVTHLGNFKEAATRYSPAEVVKAEKTVVTGDAGHYSHFKKPYRKTESHCQDARSPPDSLNKRFQQKAGKLSGCNVNAFRVLQFLQNPRRNPHDALHGRWRGKINLDCG